MPKLILDVPYEVSSIMTEELFEPKDIKVELIEEEFGNKLPHPKIRITIGRVLMEIGREHADRIATMIHTTTRKNSSKDHSTPKD